MAKIEIDRAIELLIGSPENNNQVAKGTGIHPSTISNYRTKTTKPSVPNARLLIEYFTKNHTGADNSTLKNGCTDETIANLTETVERQSRLIEKLVNMVENLQREQNLKEQK